VNAAGYWPRPAEGVSIRALAAAAGLSPAQVHWITAGADLDGLRAAGWPVPEDPDGDDDAELDGRDLICDRLLDEVGWLCQCAGWLTHLHTKEFPPVVNLRPEDDHPRPGARGGRPAPGGRDLAADPPTTSMSWPAAAAWPTSTRRLPSLTGRPNGGAG
jgi:hypothetical protein